MKLLLDEMFDARDRPLVSPALNVFGQELDCEVESLVHLQRGLTDDAIPLFCRERGFDVLVTLNVKDFGARLPLYETLITTGISVVVLRPAKRAKLRVPTQASILIRHLRAMVRAIRDAPETVLVTVSEGGIRVVRDLAELQQEVKGRVLP